MTEKARADIFIETLTQMLEVERTHRPTSLRRDEAPPDRFSNWLRGGVDGAGHPSGPTRRKAYSDRSSLGQPQYR